MPARFLQDLGKQDTSGGRKPNIYGLNPHAGYFVGVDVRRHHVSIAVTNFKGELMDYQGDIPFALTNTEQSIMELAGLIKSNVTKAGTGLDKIMSYGEYLCGGGNNERNMFFLNVGWGLGMGMILDGKLYFCKYGFSGEIGHFPLLDNEQICQCGKTGCLETGASGSAVHRMFLEKLKEGRGSLLSEKYAQGQEITLDDI